MYEKLVAKINSIAASGLFLKTKYDTDKSDLEKKFLILVALLKRLKSLKWWVKYQVLVV